MLTSEIAIPNAERLDLDVGLDGSADYAIEPDMPMACESRVADAIWHLLSGFVIVEGLGAKTRQPSSMSALAVTAQDISTVLVELDECSLGFWRLLLQAGMPRSKRPRWSWLPFRCSRDGDRAVGAKPRQQSQPESVTRGSIGGFRGSVRPDQWATDRMERDSIVISDWADSLASVVVHLVGAYRAMEALSASAFPAGAPGSFEIACHCLCSALVTLDTFLAGCEN